MGCVCKGNDDEVTSVVVRGIPNSLKDAL